MEIQFNLMCKSVIEVVYIPKRKQLLQSITHDMRTFASFARWNTSDVLTAADTSLAKNMDEIQTFSQVLLSSSEAKLILSVLLLILHIYLQNF